MKKPGLPGPFRKLAALLPSEVVDEKLLFLIAFLKYLKWVDETQRYESKVEA